MSSDTHLSEATLSYAEELTDAILGLDAVYREESGDEVGLAVLNLSADHSSEDFGGYDDAVSRFLALRDRATALPEPDRELYYRQFCDSMLAFVEWRQDRLPFPKQVDRFLHVPPEPPSTATLDNVLADLGDMLVGIGYDGDITEQCTAWKTDTTVLSDDAPSVLTDLMNKMRTKTLNTFDFLSEPIATMRSEGKANASFNAKCDFTNRSVAINTDPKLTRPWLRKLAVHEGYPGHALQFSLRRHWYDEGIAPADGLLSVVNCASSAIFEGIGDSGLALLNAGDAHDRAAALLGRYQIGIATAGAWRYHSEGWSKDELTDWLADRTVYGDDDWVRSRVEFVTAPERATLMWSYWHGEPAVTDVLADISSDSFDDFAAFLYGRMHSPQSLATFES